MDKKLIFYSELYRDSSIDKNVKQKIRDLVEDIHTYQRHLNQYLEVPIVEIDFRDVKDIAYVVGTFKDKRGNLIQKLFSSENPLDKKGRSVSDFYEKLKKENILLPGVLTEKVFTSAQYLLDYILDKRDFSIQEAFNFFKIVSSECIDYANRTKSLKTPSESENLFRTIYSKRTMQGNKSRLNQDRIKELASYFERQYHIDKILSDSLKIIHIDSIPKLSKILNN